MKHFEIECFWFEPRSIQVNSIRIPCRTLRSALRWIRRHPEHDPVAILHVAKDPVNKFRYIRTVMYIHGPNGLWHTPPIPNKALYAINMKTGKQFYWKASIDS